MNNQEYLGIEATGLGMGQTRRITCPWCMGGESGERSMNLTRKPEGLAYSCHRASCGVAGYVDGGPVRMPAALPIGGPARDARVSTGPVLPLTEEDYDYFLEGYELPYYTVNAHIYRSYDGRYILPILWRGEDRGYVLRRPWEGAPIEKPWRGIKSDVYLHDSSLPQQALYPGALADAGRTGLNVVIVEDQLSAMKAAEIVGNAVALLGSLLNLEKVREIQRLRPSEVIIALDADATELSFKYAREFGMAFPKSRVAILDKDIKDTPLSDIPAVLSL